MTSIPVVAVAAAILAAGILGARSEAPDAAPPGREERPSSRAEDAPAPAPPSDAIPGARIVEPPPDCPNGTLRTAVGDLICR